MIIFCVMISHIFPPTTIFPFNFMDNLKMKFYISHTKSFNKVLFVICVCTLSSVLYLQIYPSICSSLQISLQIYCHFLQKFLTIAIYIDYGRIQKCAAKMVKDSLRKSITLIASHWIFQVSIEDRPNYGYSSTCGLIDARLK